MSRNFDQRMQMLTPDMQKKYMEEQKSEWDKHVFNVDVPARYRMFALSFEHPNTLQVKAEYFNWLAFGEVSELTLSDAVTLCRAFTRTLQDWIRCFGRTETTSTEYAQYLAFTEEMTEKVNDVVEPISTRCFNKVEALQRLQLKNGNRQLNLA